jgi:Zn-finger nucleic acid-binding protein
MSLILDHINGDATDNRLENLQIVCPNCAATLATHCGRNNANLEPRECARCGQLFHPRGAAQRYCSLACGIHSPGSHDPQPERRKVERPPYEQLIAEIDATSYSAVGRKYGVSDNAVRKWIRSYERERLDDAA